MLRSAAPGGTLATLRERLGNADRASPACACSDVVIEGRANTPEPLLRAALGVSKGDPILGFSLNRRAQRIETLSWVEQRHRRAPAARHRSWCNLEERRPFAIWQNQGKFVLIDRDGQVVADQDVAQFRQLPLVVGAGAPAAAAALLDALTDAARRCRQRVVAAVRVGERRWNLQHEQRHRRDAAGRPRGAALDRLMQLQQTHALLDRPLAAIDMRLPDRLVLRPQPDRTGGSGRTQTKKPT